MALSPLDIHNKEFDVKLRGYSQDQVNEFLSQIIKDYSALIKENEQLVKDLNDANEKVKYFSDMKDALNQSIIVAQEAADKVKKNADDEAQLIQQKAEKNAQDMLTEATEKTNQILADSSSKNKTITVQTEDLKRQTRVFRQRLQVMLESQLEVVKSPEWKELLASTNEASDYLDPSANPDLDNEPSDSLNSEAAPEAPAATPDSDGKVYTEIVFPPDEEDEPDRPSEPADKGATPEADDATVEAGADANETTEDND